MRLLSTASGTPCRPEVKQHRLSSKVMEGNVLPIKGGKSKIGSQFPHLRARLHLRGFVLHGWCWIRTASSNQTDGYQQQCQRN
ncbi:MAG: hypothetical protein DDT27_01654 [Dehalococcoidia bacterium]|nr:hypothetical protein [Chloroflexota bacterium]MBT9163085.1 hypothetical protein [Chloroflexota bacterium]